MIGITTFIAMVFLVYSLKTISFSSPYFNKEYGMRRQKVFFIGIPSPSLAIPTYLFFW